ncbi:hypothetical protein JAAARDRAFT_35668 [Jaapia argillacea MUCL 33604]|uniref:Cytochrome P450 n=1 Tax=Jaapia argillacea MUCL 33604 TaxID=933084 RepID=A0A067Q0Q7_9AGAM|nr:hypothetical protein JAAARDRAFT_35668 [Jaapia argillacea MUCL 33604]
MVSNITVLDAGLAVVALYLLKRLLSRKATPAPLPPGPKGLPVIQNLLDMPTEYENLTFAQWGEKYGDLVSITLMGQTMIIVNSGKLAIDMLDRKSAIYSDRPVFPMGGEIIGWRDTLALTRYGQRFRDIRRMFHQIIGTKAIMSQFIPIEEQATHRFLKRVLKSPKDIAKHIRWMAGCIILEIAYGYKVLEQDDPIIDLVDKATEQFSLATSPGAYLVDVIPALQYVPDWFPGTGWKKVAAEYKATLTDMGNVPLDFTKAEMAAGTAAPSFTSNLLEGKELSDTEKDTIKWAAASLYSGGADTTVSTTYTFYLAMTLHPEILKKAQAEIDAVVGSDRLPSFEDRENLPYVNALVKEVLRWGPVTPLGLPHGSTEDDIYEGYFIPKGSIIFVNVWQLLRDPRVYANPLQFDPERFLKAEPEEDPKNFCFGFGRRICPGRILADASIYISIAMSLAVFDITKAKDERGNVLEPVKDFTSGIISHPKPFPCEIRPRSAKAEALINEN